MIEEVPHEYVPVLQLWYTLLDVSERLAQMIIVDILYWGQTLFQISQTWVKDWPSWFSFYDNIVSMQMKTTVVADILSDLTDMSERLAQMIQFLS